MINAGKMLLVSSGLFHVRFLVAALVYNLVVFTVFLAVYLRMDFDTHFSSERRVSNTGKVYFAMMTHASVGANDITPKTDAARTVVTMHALCAWLQLMLVFLSDT